MKPAPKLNYLFLKGAGFIDIILNEIQVKFNEICSQLIRPEIPGINIQNIFMK